MRIRNPASSGQWITYWYSKDLGTPVQASLDGGQSVNITGISGGIDIRVVRHILDVMDAVSREGIPARATWDIENYYSDDA